MPRARTGQIKKRGSKFIARVRWKDTAGKQREKWRTAATRTEARNLIRVLWSEVELEQEQAQHQAAAPPHTFADLAAVYLAERVIPPVYVGNRKAAGMRAHHNVAGEVQTVTKHFGPRALADITYADLEHYKRLRLATPTHHNKERKLSGFHHELRRLHAMFNFALQKRWLAVNPFQHGPSLISSADEIPRDRPRGEGEEEKLLAACVGRRAYMRPVIIIAIDTAARLGEILGLRRQDVDFDERVIHLPHTITKTARTRIVPLSERLERELRAWLHFLPNDPDALLFGGIGRHSVTYMFIQICRKAGIADLHFHDLRHWATTDIADALARAGIAIQHGMAITGHAQERTFRRYLRTDNTTVRAAGEALEALRSAKNEPKREQKREKEAERNSDALAPVSKLRKIK